METQRTDSQIALPRIAITFCTQCRWMLRAAYYGQELLSTFGTSIGEIALLPSTGGTFKIELVYQDGASGTQTAAIWDRKTDGGFPETKVLKQKIRDHIEPGKDLGHSDRKPAPKTTTTESEAVTSTTPAQADNCEDCK